MDRESSEASPSPIIFDTDVLIWYFRANEKARRLLETTSYSARAISSLSWMELLQGCRSRDKIRELRRFINENVPAVFHPEEPVCLRAIGLLDRHALSDGLRVVDAMIAATAIEHGCPLATANTKHYRVIDELHMLPFKP